MSQYFYSDGKDRFGPFSIEELKAKNITPDTLIWFEGLSDWTSARDLPELRELIQLSSDPPEPSSTDLPDPVGGANTPLDATHSGVKPKNWLLESILVTIFCCLPFGIVGIIFAARVDSSYAAGDYQGAERSSKEAGKWTKIGFFSGIAVIVLYFLYFIIIGATAFTDFQDF